MRASFYTPTVADFDAVFADVGHARGGSYNDIHIYSRKRGGSLFGVLGRVLKSSIPFLRSVILPEFGGFVKNVTDDVSNNLPIKSSLKRNLMNSAKNVGKRVVRGGGRSRASVGAGRRASGTGRRKRRRTAAGGRKARKKISSSGKPTTKKRKKSKIQRKKKKKMPL